MLCGVVWYDGYFLHADLIGADELEDVPPFGEIARCCAGECCIHKQLASCTSTQAGNRAMTALTRVGEVELLVELLTEAHRALVVAHLLKVDRV